MNPTSAGRTTGSARCWSRAAIPPSGPGPPFYSAATAHRTGASEPRAVGGGRRPHHRHHGSGLWRIIEHYVGQAVARLDLGRLKAIGLDETASKPGYNYVTVFIDLDRKQKPLVGERRGVPRLPASVAVARANDFPDFPVDQAASLRTRARSKSRLRWFSGIA